MKVTLKVEGMSCSMCEAHICETIRKVVPDAKKVKASKRKGTATFVTDDSPNEGYRGNRLHMYRHGCRVGI